MTYASHYKKKLILYVYSHSFTLSSKYIFTTSDLCKFLLKKNKSFILVCCSSKNLFMLFESDLTDVTWRWIWTLLNDSFSDIYLWLCLLYSLRSAESGPIDDDIDETHSDLHVVPFYIYHKRTIGCQKYLERARSAMPWHPFLIHPAMRRSRWVGKKIYQVGPTEYTLALLYMTETSSRDCVIHERPKILRITRNTRDRLFSISLFVSKLNLVTRPCSTTVLGVYIYGIYSYCDNIFGRVI